MTMRALLAALRRDWLCPAPVAGRHAGGAACVARWLIVLSAVWYLLVRPWIPPAAVCGRPVIRARRAFSDEPLPPVHVFYRISDGVQIDPYGRKNVKTRPEYYSKRLCLEMLLDAFHGAASTTVIADNVTDATMRWLTEMVPRKAIERSSYGNGGHVFLHTVRLATQRLRTQPDAVIYLVEDDYFHVPRAAAMVEGLAFGEYATGHDHPDKYISWYSWGRGGQNPGILSDGEDTTVFASKTGHWKRTGSTTMTFMTTVGTAARDYPLYEKYCSGRYPHDFKLFSDLAARGAHVVSAIPALSAHTVELPPVVDWAAAAANIQRRRGDGELRGLARGAAAAEGGGSSSSDDIQ